MINGVLNIVAAVLFAVVAVKENFSTVWTIIAGVYLFAGVIDLIVHSIKVSRMKKTAMKAEQEKIQQAAAKAEQEKLQKAQQEQQKKENTEAGIGG